MLRDTLVSLLALRLGNRTDLNAAIILEMQVAQETLLEGTGAFLPWFLEKEASPLLASTAGVETIALPSDFLGELEDGACWRHDAAASPVDTLVPKGSYANLLAKFPAPSIPQRYSLGKAAINLHPTPDAVYSFRFKYYARNAVLSTNIENDWLAHASDLMFAEVGAIMAGRYLQNPALEMSFRQDAANARARLYTKHESRQHTNVTYSMGDD